jgi:hypothetical protein
MAQIKSDKTVLAPLSSKLQLALKACHVVGPTLTGEICFGWIPEKFKAKGVTYRDLAKLARLGYLKRTGEGRYCVYYRVVQPTKKRQPRTSAGKSALRRKSAAASSA